MLQIFQYMKKTITLSLFFLLPLFSFSQNSTTRYFKGRIDDFNDIRIHLTCNDSHCTGEMKYLRSKTVFDLKGRQFGNYLELKEIDPLGNVSGQINGKLINQNIDAQWFNHNRSISYQILLKETTLTDDLPTYCGENKWITQLVHKSTENNLALLLQTGANNQLYGTADWDGKIFKIQGHSDKKNGIDIRLKGENGAVITLKSPTRNPSRTIKAIITEKDKTPKSLSFKTKDKITVGCVRYADYMTAYDATFPKLKNKAFNNWVEKQIFDWAANCKIHANQNQKKDLSPELRASDRATTWVDLTYFSNTLISGFIIFNDYEKEKPRCIPFNFDLKKGIVLIKNDLFKSFFDLPSFTKKVAVNFFKNHQLYDDDDFRAWITAVEFPHFTIQKKGICFWTDFDQIYGQQRMLIPYIELAQFFKPNFPEID